MAKNILIPQYSLRWLLIVTAACGVVFSIFGVAAREYDATYKQGCWATGVSIAILSLVCVLLIHAAVFGAVWVFSEAASARQSRKAGTAPDIHLPGPVAPKDDEDGPVEAIILE